MAEQTVVQVRVCNKCGVEKEIGEFNRHRGASGGRRSHCRDCTSLQSKVWKLHNPDKVFVLNKRRHDDAYIPRANRVLEDQPFCASCKSFKNRACFGGAPKDGRQWQCYECKESYKLLRINGENRVCARCNETKPLAMFHLDRTTKAGVRSKCRECTSFVSREYRNSNPEKIKRWTTISRKNRKDETKLKIRQNTRFRLMKDKYGLTREMFVQMLEEQGSTCAICLIDIAPAPEGKGGRFAACVDHDHETNDIRGPLCHGCNTGIGLLKENSDVLEAAARYLRKYGK